MSKKKATPRSSNAVVIKPWECRFWDDGRVVSVTIDKEEHKVKERCKDKNGNQILILDNNTKAILPNGMEKPVEPLPLITKPEHNSKEEISYAYGMIRQGLGKETILGDVEILTGSTPTSKISANYNTLYSTNDDTHLLVELTSDQLAEKIKELNKKAINCFKNKEYSNAIANYAKAFDVANYYKSESNNEYINKMIVSLYYNRARAYDEDKQFLLAREGYKAALELDPKHSKAQKYLSKYWYNKPPPIHQINNHHGDKIFTKEIATGLWYGVTNKETGNQYITNEKIMVAVKFNPSRLIPYRLCSEAHNPT